MGLVQVEVLRESLSQLFPPFTLDIASARQQTNVLRPAGLQRRSQGGYSHSVEVRVEHQDANFRLFDHGRKRDQPQRSSASMCRMSLLDAIPSRKSRRVLVLDPLPISD